MSACSRSSRRGDQLIQEIERRTEGAEAEPGSVYPALQQLEDQGLVRPRRVRGQRAYDLTAEGRDTSPTTARNW